MDLPAVVVGSGPSLDAALPWLAAHQDRVAVIACGSALLALLRGGVRPDVHVELENIEVLPVIDEVRAEFDLAGIALVASASVEPGVADVFDRVVYFMRPGLSTAPVFCADTGNCLARPDPTVVNAGVAFALGAGFGDIRLVGVDFGVADPEHHHSRQTYHYGDNPLVQDRDLEFDIRVAGNFGGERLTSRGLYTARNALVQALAAAPPGVRVVNASDGVAIDGAAPVRLETLEYPAPTGGKAAAIADLFGRFDTFDAARLAAAWGDGADVRQAAAAVARALSGRINAEADIADKAYLGRLMAELRPDAVGADGLEGGADMAARRLYRGSVLMMLIGVEWISNRIADDDARRAFWAEARPALVAAVEGMAGVADDLLADILGRDPPPADSPVERDVYVGTD